MRPRPSGGAREWSKGAFRVSLLRVSLLALWLGFTGGCGGPANGPSATTGGGADRRDPRPDVVLITLDTFRPDRLGSEGGDRVTAPFLEDLMHRSVIFERAFSTSSWTAPATSSLLTGTYPVRHGVIEGFMAHRQRLDQLGEDDSSPTDGAVERDGAEGGVTVALNRLSEGLPTLAEILRGEGYRTLGLSSNINIGPEIGLDRGFDHFEQFGDWVPAEQLAARLVSWSEGPEWGEGPRFIYLHVNDVHGPYEERAPWFVPSDDPLEQTRSAYDSQISYLDGVLAGLYQRFGWDRRTLFAVVSDHGEELGERGRVGHFFSLHQELMRVLMVFSAPDLGVVGGRRLAFNVSLIDVVPTILDLLGMPAKDQDGLSLAPWLLEASGRDNEAAVRRRTLFGHRQRWDVERGARQPRHLWAAVRGGWKLIDRPAGPQKRRPLLYDLESDGAELDDLAPRARRARRAETDPGGQGEPEARVLDELQTAIDRFRAGGFHQGERREISLDAEALERLEALGYVQ